MGDLKLSVIIPTRSRLDKLAVTIACLERQSLAAGEYEIIVVDDGSVPAVTLAETPSEPRCTLLQLEGRGRSEARNAGADEAQGDLLVFVDDDITVRKNFLAAHLQAHDEWPGALVVGNIRLPDDAVAKPFGRFRQNLETQGIPKSRGLTSMRNFCTAANMSLPRSLYQTLGGFDPVIHSSEDQDLALRHTERGGEIVFVPEAEAVHWDSALDIRSYCRRAEWGSEQMVPFCQRHPDWPDNVERDRVNGPVRWGRDCLSENLRKRLKRVLALKPAIACGFAIASILERIAPASAVLDRTYRLLLGAHIFRGHRKGLRRYKIVADKGKGEATRVSDPAMPDGY